MQAANPCAWAERAVERRRYAFAAAIAMTTPHLPDPRQRSIVVSVLEDAAVSANRPEVPPLFPLPAQLPLAVHAALAESDRDAMPVAAAGILVLLGADLLDALMDGDPFTGPIAPAERLLLGAGLIGPLPTLILASMPVPPEEAIAAVRDLADALVTMGAGQLTDLRSVGAAGLGVGDAMETAVFKSAPLVGALCRIAARRAGATPRQEAAAGRLGAILAVADQLRGDWADLARLTHSNDARTGVVTVPVALSRSVDAAMPQPELAEPDPIEVAASLLDHASQQGLAAVLASCEATARSAIDDLDLPRGRSRELARLATATCTEGGP